MKVWLRALVSALLFGVTLEACSAAPSVAPTTPNLDPVAHRATAAHRAPSDGFTLLYQFTGSPDGVAPYAGPTVDKVGNIFGATFEGGTYGCGTAFKLTPAGSTYEESILHSFRHGRDGCGPYGNPIEDRDGNLFLTVAQGGRHGNFGTAVKLSPAGGTYLETAVHSFGYGADGAEPLAPFLQQGKVLYLATDEGGKYGFGAILGLNRAGLKPTVLHSFDVSDGANPQGALTADATGALYGTTFAGGTSNAGTVFKFVPQGSGGTETVLWDFDGTDGSDLRGNILVGNDGSIYGTTQFEASGTGLLYKLSPGSGGYIEKILHRFGGAGDGYFPTGLVAVGRELYGTTFNGGNTECGGQGCGTLYSISTSGAGYAILHTFEGSDGGNPGGTLATDGRALYGTTAMGGTSNSGVVYRFVP